MPETKGTRAAADRPTETAAQGTASTPGPLQSDANPQGQPDVSTGPVGPAEVQHAGEHVLGDDPRRTAHRPGYHDSLSGRPVTESGEFVEADMEGQGPIPKNRIVADNWPQEREKIDDPTKRKGNTAQ